MARPEPNTKAPALAKNSAIWPRAPRSVANIDAARGRLGAKPTAVRLAPGRHLVRQSQAITPAARNKDAPSDSVTMVTAADTIQMAHSNLSLPMLLVVSFCALMAMMPITAAPTP